MTRFLYGGNVHANGIRQHYLRYGGVGPPLLVVPGITSPAITWGFVAEELATTHDVFVLDVRGRGLSEAGPHLDYRLNACAADIPAFVAALRLRDVNILGHSMGARHAIRAFRLDPSHVTSLILADPPVSGPNRRAYPSRLGWYIDSMALCRSGADGEALLPFSPTWSDAQRALRAEWLHTCDQAAVLSSFASFHDDDVHGDLPHLSVPTLLLRAEHGDVVRDEDAAEFLRLAPNLTDVRLRDAGHMIPWDNLPAFVSAVRSFLGA